MASLVDAVKDGDKTKIYTELALIVAKTIEDTDSGRDIAALTIKLTDLVNSPYFPSKQSGVKKSRIVELKELQRAANG